jgi:hypothetical protein
MNFPQTLAVLVFAVILTGCDSSQPQSTTPPAKPHYQRFIPIQAVPYVMEGVPWHGYFALDTKTGTLCTTVKNRVFRKGPAEWANDVPSCNDILAADHE